MTITTQMKAVIKDSYKVLRNAYYLKETVFSNEFDKARELADCRMDGLVDTLCESAFGLYRLGLLPEEELNEIRKCADKLHKFVGLAVEHYHNIEKAHDKRGYYSRDYDHIKEAQGYAYTEKEFVDTFGTKVEYIKEAIEYEFDDIDVDLKAMFSYFNMLK